MLMAVIPVTSYRHCQAMIKANEAQVDGFELRWDYCQDFSTELMRKVRDLSSKPVIFTLRRQEQGGEYRGNFEEYWSILQGLAATFPDYLDLDYALSTLWFEDIAKNFPQIKVILSMHVYDTKSFDWKREYLKCQHLPHASFKLALSCDSGLAALRFLQQGKSFPFLVSRSLIAMGTHASFARVLGPCLDNCFDYAYVDGAFASAPGQLSVKDLLTIYRYSSLSPSTALYGLIGHPVEESVGHVYHNRAFAQLKKNAVYVKISIDEDELEEALDLTLALNFQGLSVTMPLKQKLSKILASPLPAINTLKKRGHQWMAYNVDGIGALEAYEAHRTHHQKRMVILGNGGAALAIKAAFREGGYQVEVVARRPKIGEHFDLSLLNLSSEDGMINTLPGQAFDTKEPWTQAILAAIKPGMKIMDIDYRQESLFFRSAREKNCHLISGMEMYLAQAKHQLQQWFKFLDD